MGTSGGASGPRRPRPCRSRRLALLIRAVYAGARRASGDGRDLVDEALIPGEKHVRIVSVRWETRDTIIRILAARPGKAYVLAS
ncbi:hypothetical protein GCM10009550_44280 [Actinocorallia libanotica]|uniref:Uncharacterized protein n=1 Tax=Actinocorallia libanotica TaxID=46162 RepID=A0ABN1RHB9_9ACTN